MHSFEGKIIWITGASSGIGEALAYEWSKSGARIILSARRENELQRVKAACAHPDLCEVVPLDLSDQKQIETTAEQVLQQFGTVDILVNNGGISQRSLVIDTDVAVDRRIMEVDYFSGVILSKKLLPAMIAKGSGHIVAISSIVGMFGFPLRSAYSAAKHAIHGFYESVWAELHQQGIRVTVACPGRILTNVSLHALTKDGTPHGIMDHAQENGITAETCARKIIKAVKRNKKEVYIGKKDLLMIYFKRYIPWLYYKLVSKVQPK
ncbi:MAG: SDR family oxidoreductase [Bacteroidales bacterium]|jgi:short-subunit dehydrogenase|nr:SDR family oxidoreductase [Bacteroidales bacterium]